MNKIIDWGRMLALLLCVFVVAGCATKSQHRSSSVMQYLYPKQEVIVTPSMPRLTLPLRVGIAFVPESFGVQALTESHKMGLMKEVSQHFKQYDFVKSITLIPSAYLRKEGSFSNLDQVRTMHGIDVVVLLSYDQTQFTDEGFAAVTYWTLVGAYLIPGEKNATHTMLDAAVYDIQSRNMLFRAPGVSHIKSKATPVNLSETLRADSLNSFQLASADLIKNLDLQLSVFRERIKESPDEYQIVHRQGYTGGGSVDAFFLWFALLMLGYAMLKRRLYTM